MNVNIAIHIEHYRRSEYFGHVDNGMETETGNVDNSIREIKFVVLVGRKRNIVVREVCMHRLQIIFLHHFSLILIAV